MTQQFVLFWMNKNLDLGCYSPENLQKTIQHMCWIIFMVKQYKKA